MSARAREAGVTLMEIVVALFILSVVLVSLGGLMSQVSLRTRQATALSYLSGAVQAAEARVAGLPWDSLYPGSSVTNTSTDTVGQLVYVRTTNVSGTDPKAVQVVLTPTGLLTAPAETVVVYRTRPRGTVPFTP